MAGLYGQDDNGFDLNKASRCVQSYSISTGLQCTLIDTYGHILDLCSDSRCNSKFCRTVSNSPEGGKRCRNVHLYGSYQSERFGGKYVFFCPMGLVHWASPVVSDGIMIGALLGGPVLMVEPDEFLIDEIILKNNIDKEQTANLLEAIKEVPVIQPEVVNSLSELLFITASYISGPASSPYLEKSYSVQQQADISEYIKYIKSTQANGQGLKAYPLDKEKELLSLISIGDKAGSQKLLNELLGYIFFYTSGSFQVFKTRILELLVLLSRGAMQGGADPEEIFGLNFHYLSQINQFNTTEDLTYWLSGILARFTDCVFNLADVKHVDIMYKAADYIRRNYVDKITLEQVASYVFLSPSYFSKVFKEEMKCSFNTYLNSVRIEMSKKLLADESTALVEIPSLVGYEDQSYFTKVFKKMVGTSPGKYRESRGRRKANNH